MAVKDLVSGVLAESITTSTTNVLVTIAENIGRPGILAFFPTPPFYITIMPKSPAVGVANRLDSEILQVTAVGNDQVGNAALTCVRGQRDTTAKAFEAGSIVTVGVYTDDAVLLGGTGTTETETPWVGTDMIENGAVTPEKASFTKYLASETIVGTWIDGKPLYRKVIQINNPTVNATTNYAHNTPIDLGWVVAMFVINAGNQNATRAINYMYTTSAYATSQLSQTSLSYRVPAAEWGWADSNVSALIAIIEYTKTTD